MREPFAIARGVQTEQPTVLVTLSAGGVRGRGEGCGVPYAGETPSTMLPQLEAVREALEAGADRAALLELLPPGGARCAADAALWDLEAKQSGVPAFERAGLEPPRPVITAFTIGIRSLDAYAETAARVSRYAVLKVKVGAGQDPVAVAEAVRHGAPQSRLIFDPNQSWSVDDLQRLAGPLAERGVVLLEQPIPVGAEAGLDGWRSPIALCADELVNGEADLEKAHGRFQVINIKLDKTGGLTTALKLAAAAQARGFGLMVGCMAGSSLSMAPALLLAQRCQFVDLDGPLLQAEDWPDGLVYDNGVVHPPQSSFWG